MWNLLFVQIVESKCRSSNALWKMQFYEAIKVSMSVFKDMSTLFNVCVQTKGSLLLPLKTCSPKELLYCCLQCVLMKFRHAGVCSDRFLMTDQSYIPKSCSIPSFILMWALSAVLLRKGLWVLSAQKKAWEQAYVIWNLLKCTQILTPCRLFMAYQSYSPSGMDNLLLLV